MKMYRAIVLSIICVMLLTAPHVGAKGNTTALPEISLAEEVVSAELAAHFESSYNPILAKFWSELSSEYPSFGTVEARTDGTMVLRMSKLTYLICGEALLEDKDVAAQLKDVAGKVISMLTRNWLDVGGNRVIARDHKGRVIVDTDKDL